MFNQLFGQNKPLIGMIHLPPLAGYPEHPGMNAVIQKACKDLETLQEAGFDAVLVENDNDQPHQINVPDDVVVAFRLVMETLLKQAAIPVGMEIIYDMPKTLKVAHSVSAQFVRFDVFVDDVITEWGTIPAQADQLMKKYVNITRNRPLVIADVHVKHSTILTNKSLVSSALETIDKGAHCIIVTGDWTGRSPALPDCKALKAALPDTPVLIGSGFSDKNAQKLLPYCDGIIVGSSIKTGNNIDLKKASHLVKKVRELIG